MTAMPNDEVGGWDVANFDTNATSKLNRSLGQRVIAECYDERVARLIAKQHNDVLERHEDKVWGIFFDELVLTMYRKGSTYEVKHRVSNVHSPSAHVAVLKGLVEEFQARLENGLLDD
jgi:hypothetical protein